MQGKQITRLQSECILQVHSESRAICHQLLSTGETVMLTVTSLIYLTKLKTNSVGNNLKLNVAVSRR